MDATPTSRVGDPAPSELVPLRRNRDFNLLWGGQAASLLGSEISEIAYPLLILAVTGSAAQAGLVAAAVFLTHVLVLLPAGVVADRYPRRRTMIVTSVVQVLTVGSVAVAVLGGHVVVAHLIAVGAVQGAASAFYIGANRGAIRRIVPPPQLPTALARSQARDQTAFMVGPIAGGVLFGVARFLPFLVDAVSFVVIAVAAALVRGPVDAPANGANGARGGMGSGDPSGGDVGGVAVREPLRLGVTRGMRFIFGNPYLRTVALWAAAINALSMGMLLMTIVLAQHRGAGPAMVGVVIGIGSVGGLTGALASGWLIRRFRSRRLVLVASWVLTTCPVGMALAPSPALIGVSSALAMGSIMPVNVILLTRAAMLTPHDMQGQAGNATMLVGSSLKWVAGPVFGLLADGLGPVTATLIGAVLYVATAVWLQGRASLHQLDEPVPEAVPIASI